MDFVWLLPCKIVPYDEQGKTKIGLPRPTALVSISTVVDAKIKEHVEDIEQSLIGCIDKSIG